MERNFRLAGYVSLGKDWGRNQRKSEASSRTCAGLTSAPRWSVGIQSPTRIFTSCVTGSMRTGFIQMYRSMVRISTPRSFSISNSAKYQTRRWIVEMFDARDVQRVLARHQDAVHSDNKRHIAVGASDQEIALDVRRGPPSGYTPIFTPA